MNNTDNFANLPLETAEAVAEAMGKQENAWFRESLKDIFASYRDEVLAEKKECFPKDADGESILHIDECTDGTFAAWLEGTEREAAEGYENYAMYYRTSDRLDDAAARIGEGGIDAFRKQFAKEEVADFIGYVAEASRSIDGGEWGSEVLIGLIEEVSGHGCLDGYLIDDRGVISCSED